MTINEKALVVWLIIIPIIIMIPLIKFGLKRIAFKKYMESYLQLAQLLTEAYDTNIYNRVAVLRVENNGGVPKLGHPVYISLVDERYSNHKSWKQRLTRRLVDLSTAQVILNCFMQESCIILVETLDGDIADLIKQDDSLAIGCAVVKQNDKELYLFVATFEKLSGGNPYGDFPSRALKIKYLFHHS